MPMTILCEPYGIREMPSCKGRSKKVANGITLYQKTSNLALTDDRQSL